MHFMLLHSPLVPKETWRSMVLTLDAAGVQATVAALDNNAPQGISLFEHHNAQIESALASLTKEKVIAVAHSGAGNLLAFLDPERFEGHVFLDAIFPNEQASRFELFDDPSAIESWQEIAGRHDGMLPKKMLARFGEQINDEKTRQAFVAEMVDVPIDLYKESIPIHSNWPRSKRGLYVQWTENYSADAARASRAGFKVHREAASHFKMLNQPNEVTELLVDFAKAIE